MHALTLGCVQRHGADAAGTQGVGGDGTDGDVDWVACLQCGVERAAVLRFGRHNTEAMLLGSGCHAREQSAAPNSHHQGVQARELPVDLLQQGASPRCDQRMVVGVRGQRAGRGGELLTRGQRLGVLQPDQPYLGAVPAQPGNLHRRRGVGKEHRRADPVLSGRPGARHPRVATGSDRHARVRQGARLTVRHSEVRGAASLERTGVLHELQRQPQLVRRGPITAAGALNHADIHPSSHDRANPPRDPTRCRLDIAVRQSLHVTAPRTRVRGHRLREHLTAPQVG